MISGPRSQPPPRRGLRQVIVFHILRFGFKDRHHALMHSVNYSPALPPPPPPPLRFLGLDSVPLGIARVPSEKDNCSYVLAGLANRMRISTRILPVRQRHNIRARTKRNVRPCLRLPWRIHGAVARALFVLLASGSRISIVCLYTLRVSYSPAPPPFPPKRLDSVHS